MEPPFNPPEIYPEYPFRDSTVDLGNSAYSSVRGVFHLLKMDIKNFGTARWNPLGEIISPGDTVVIKPNFVHHSHPLGLEYMDCKITHGSILRVMVDYVFIATGIKGKIIIADAPLRSTDFNEILRINKIFEIVKYYKSKLNFEIKVIDLRPWWVECDKEGVVIKKQILGGDPLGYCDIDLGVDSEFSPIASGYKRYRVCDYSKRETIAHHNLKTNRYCISKTILSADAIINVPKLKTHIRAGVTISLKNLIGINGEKGWLPHHRVRSPSEGGDEYLLPNQIKQLKSFLRMWKTTHPYLWKITQRVGEPIVNLMKNIKKPLEYSKVSSFNPSDITDGCWYGNDTLWRSILDVNKIIFYADKDGRMSPERKRKYFTLVDGIVAGEEEGPLEPAPKRCGILIGGFNPIAVDMGCVRLMGFNYQKIPQIKNASKIKKYSFGSFAPEEIKCFSNIDKWSMLFKDNEDGYLKFIPTKGWKGHIELEKGR